MKLIDIIDVRELSLQHEVFVSNRWYKVRDIDLQTDDNIYKIQIRRPGLLTVMQQMTLCPGDRLKVRRNMEVI